jgi:hypothetical protein
MPKSIQYLGRAAMTQILKRDLDGVRPVTLNRPEAAE